MLRSWFIVAYASAALAQFHVNHTQYEGSPVVYPSPRTVGIGGWDAALEKARAFLAALTIEENAQVVTGTSLVTVLRTSAVSGNPQSPTASRRLTGQGTSGPCVDNIAPIERLNFSGLCLHDGPLSVRQAVYVSVFSAGVSAASSLDRSLVRQRGGYMGTEFRKKGAHVALGPVVGALGRSPFAGRNWEGFSPDAYLSGVLVEQTLHGIQSAGVQACTKQYIGKCKRSPRNIQET